MRRVLAGDPGSAPTRAVVVNLAQKIASSTPAFSSLVRSSSGHRINHLCGSRRRTKASRRPGSYRSSSLAGQGSSRSSRISASRPPLPANP